MRLRERSFSTILGVIALLAPISASLILPGCAPAKVPLPERGAGTRRMAARLAALADSFGTSPFVFGDTDDPAAKPASSNGPVAAYTTARRLLEEGETEEAIAGLKALADLADAHPANVSSAARDDIEDLLAIAYLRLGEQRNCRDHHTSDSCILPIRGGGVHRAPEGSRAAIATYEKLLARSPGLLHSRFLLNVAYMTVGEYPDGVPPDLLIPPSAFDSERAAERFTDVAPALGVAVLGTAGGVAIEDFDGDGYLDLMVSAWGLRDQLRFFHNNGDGTFGDRSDAAGLIGITGGLNLVHADYDNDGHPDLFIPRGAWRGKRGEIPNSLLHNNGDGTFEDVTDEARVLSFHPTQTAAWADYDGDGWLDLFVGNESTPDLPHPCELYHNNRDGTFTEVAASAGVAVVGFIKGATWGDYDNDNRPDLYVSSLMEPNQLFYNLGPDADGVWRFADRTKAAGVSAPRHSFATWFWDYDNDGWLDLFVNGYDPGILSTRRLGDTAADYLHLPTDAERPRLYRNHHDGTFEDVTRQVHLDRVLFAMGSNFGDLDNDGWPDLYLGTGAPDYRTLMPNRMFHNTEGQRFDDITTAAGVGHLQKGHAVAFGDLDIDGDLDIFEKVGGAFPGDTFPSVLFANPGGANHWITLRLEGVQANRGAIGARIRVRVRAAEGIRDVHALVSSGGSFGASALEAHIGLGQALGIESIEIRWPAPGTVQELAAIEMDQVWVVREGEAARVWAPARFSIDPAVAK